MTNPSSVNSFLPINLVNLFIKSIGSKLLLVPCKTSLSFRSPFQNNFKFQNAEATYFIFIMYAIQTPKCNSLMLLYQSQIFSTYVYLKFLFPNHYFHHHCYQNTKIIKEQIMCTYPTPQKKRKLCVV